MRAYGAVSIVIGLVVGFMPARCLAQNCEGEHWTTSSEFAEGSLSANLDNTDGKLTVVTPDKGMYSYVNVACSGRGTVARIYVGSGVCQSGQEPGCPKIVGEYWTFPSTNGHADNSIHGDPSRTTVDHRGNTWVANRGEQSQLLDAQGQPYGEPMGSITRIALVEGGTRCDNDQYHTSNPNGQYLKPPFTYVSVGAVDDPDAWTLLDRDDDGLLKTSRGLGDVQPWTNTIGNNTHVDTNGGISTAEDELITNYTRVDGTAARTMAIDFDNNLWVGGYGNHVYQKINGTDGLPFDPNLYSNVQFTSDCGGTGGYGGLVDHLGQLWSIERNNGLLRYNLRAATAVQTCLYEYTNYGIAIDPLTGHIWISKLGGGEVCEIDPETQSGQPLNCYSQGFQKAQGLAIDGRGHVWVASAHDDPGDRVLHLAPDPDYPGQYYTVGYVTGFNGTTGVAPDKYGRIWVSELEGNCASRIDPNAGDIVRGNRVGVRETSIDLRVPEVYPDPQPYNYSDMTGFVAQQPLWQGRWTVIHDGGVPNGRWNRLRWNTEACEQPVDVPTNIIARVRAADSTAAFAPTFTPPLPWREVRNGEYLCWLRGQYIQVEMDLKGNNAFSDEFRSPVLCDVSIDSFEENDPGVWVVYVKQDAQGNNTGASWADAFTDLQSALTVAGTQYAAAGCAVEIWVAEGTYKPDQGPGITPGDRSARFTLHGNLALYGGFAGGEESRDLRNPAVHPTVLGGDLGSNDPVVSDNTYYVVRTPSGEWTNAIIIDGFTIRDAVDAGLYDDGLYDEACPTCGPLTVANCRFEDNTGAFGGAIRATDAGQTTVSHCVFDGNTATGSGGAVFVSGQGTPTVENCTFMNNRAEVDGGAVDCETGGLVLTNCTFLGNTASGAGGAVWSISGTTTLRNCLLVGNSAVYGGAAGSSGTEIVLANCTFSGNTATEYGGAVCAWSNLTVANCILWGDYVGQSVCEIYVDGTVIVSYSDVDGGTGQPWFNGTCKDANPRFVNAAGGDYRLSGTSPDISPCIDAGDPSVTNDGSTDLDGNPRVLNCRVDMGAYEWECASAPTVTSINPAEGAQGGHLEYVSVGGTGFLSTCTTVRLIRDGQADIMATDVNVGSAQSLTCTLDIPANAGAGAWDVVVTTCADSEPLEGQFTVNCAAPTIDSISPSESIQGMGNRTYYTDTVPPGPTPPTGKFYYVDPPPLKVVITGTNFVDGGTTVKLVAQSPPVGGEVELTVTPTTVTATRIDGRVDDLTGSFPGSLDGVWDLVVQTDCDSVTKTGAFTVSMCFADRARPDGDGDGDVDLLDFYSALQACFNGPNRPYKLPNNTVCACMDADTDVDVDQADFMAFQAVFNGPNRPPKVQQTSAPEGEGMFASRDLLEGDGLDSFEVTFDLQSPQAGQTISAGTPVEWHAAVGVTGESQGLGGYVFSLFLGPGTGPTPGPDGIWGNSDDQNLASIELATAQWPETFAVPGANGKPTSGAALYATGAYGGPGMDRATSVGYNEKPGTLLQVGNGHLAWAPWRYYPPPLGWRGDNTWGVGLDSRKATLLLDTEGDYEVNAGEIDTTNLSAGHYVLTLVPSAAATVLDPAVDLSVSQPGGLMLYAESVNGPVSIEFDIGEE